ncbi:MAG: UdgX family uracil-DNA binding protein [Candidatus Eremiobacteraeota bacterium]|nr:UdgX family uracil-DNA binding protein [Candidatus Eremiobacteraeota bacterium]
MHRTNRRSRSTSTVRRRTEGDLTSAAPYVPATRSLRRLREAAAVCHGCDLYRDATQTVFGEGKASASLMFVGEQPGDAEDRQGHPFVGPAGRVLHDAMQQAGIDPRAVYITNAVKHFKFVVRGKRRIHAKPKVLEIQACRPWLAAEIDRVRPHLVVALGASAAQSLLGPKFRLTQHRGEVQACDLAPRVMATVHPSSILREPDDAARHQAMRDFVTDLRVIMRRMEDLTMGNDSSQV